MILIMVAVRTSETSVYFYKTTRRNIPEGFHRHTRRRENLKSDLGPMSFEQLLHDLIRIHNYYLKYFFFDKMSEIVQERQVSDFEQCDI
jgi:hypothetical protein